MTTTSLISFGAGAALLGSAGLQPVQAGPVCTLSVSGPSGPVSNGGTINCISISNATVTGNVGNTGNLTSGSAGIAIVNSAIAGSVLNSGTIAGGITVDRLSTISTSSTRTLVGISSTGSTFLGGINNAGTIAGVTQERFGINVTNVANTAIGGPPATITGTFAGGIANTGTISNFETGIQVGPISNFSGGITNSGTISLGANGISVLQVSTFTGGITNGTGGTISSQGGVGLRAVGISNFSGGVTNNGSVSAGIGIVVGGTAITVSGSGGGMQVPPPVSSSIFSGGIKNTGTVLASSVGIVVFPLVAFSGGISNSGTITATTGVGVQVKGFASFTAGNLAISTFLGGINNCGTIAAKTGIVIGPLVSTFLGAIVNSGNITGTGGVAIDVSQASNAITINQQGGTITGAINLSPFADQLNITGGAIAGNIVGQGLANITFALGAGILLPMTTRSPG